jgi:MFS family permease
MKHSAFVLLCSIGGLAIFSSTIAKNPVLPILAQQIGADSVTIGEIAAASTVTGILASFPAGFLSDRWGRKPLLLTAGAVFCSAPLAYLLISTSLELALVRVYHGLATAIFGPVAMAYVTDLAATRRGEQLGWYSSMTLGGRALAPVFGGILLTISTWQSVYVVCAVIGTLALLLMLRLPEKFTGQKLEQNQAVKKILRKTQPKIGRILSNRTILVTSVVEASQYLAFGAVETFLPLYALSVGINITAVGLLFGSQIGVKVLARPLMGKMSDRYGRKWQILAGLLLTGLATCFFPQTRRLPLLLIISAVFGLGIAIATAATSAFVADLAPVDSRGTALGLMSTIMDVGQASGPILLGAILMHTSYSAGFTVIGGLVLFAALVFALTATEVSPRAGDLR